MKQYLFKHLPSEIFTDILLSLSLQNIAICKCVCKPWLSLIESDVFLESHFSKSAPALVVSMPATNSNWFNLFKLEEDVFEYEKKQDPITKFDFPQASTIQASANGLLLLKNPFSDHLYVCNPIAREFVELCGSLTHPWGDCYGFGVSKISGQHKVVYFNPKSGCHVYTLETGSSWRRVEVATPSLFRCYNSIGAFVCGNLHLLFSNSAELPFVCCFDLETERFSTFSAPSGEDADKHFQSLKVYRNGELMLCLEKRFFYYSKESGNVTEIGLFGKMDDDCYYINAIVLTPSFLSLKRNLGLENVISF